MIPSKDEMMEIIVPMLLASYYWWYAIYGTVLFTRYDTIREYSALNVTESCDMIYPYIKAKSIVSWFLFPVINDIVFSVWGSVIYIKYINLEYCAYLDTVFKAGFFYSAILGIIMLIGLSCLCLSLICFTLFSCIKFCNKPSIADGKDETKV